MKIEITATIASALHIDVRPEVGVPPDKWPANPDRQPYVVTDAIGPTGFGIKVTASNASFIVQKRVRASGPGAVIRATLGRVTEMTVQQARKRRTRCLTASLKRGGHRGRTNATATNEI